MMKLTDRATGGIFDLPPGIKISIERTNPFLSDLGSASLTLRLPRTPNNDRLLGWPHRTDRAAMLQTRRDVILMAGSYQEAGALQVTAIPPGQQFIDCILLINESEIYRSMDNTQMADVFTRVRNDFSGSVEYRRLMWLNYFDQILFEEQQDDFFIFSVGFTTYKSDNFVDSYDTIFRINQQMGSGTAGISRRPLRKEDVILPVNGVDELYPMGSFTTPFLKIPYVLKTIFAHFGYTFDTAQLPRSFSRMVILNNTADAIMEGQLSYRQLVPTCSVYRFISSFMKKFGCIFNFSSATREVTLTFLRDIDMLISRALDFTVRKRNLPGISFEPLKSVSLACGHSKNKYTSAFATFDDFLNSYPQYHTYDKFPIVAVPESEGTLPYPEGTIYFSRIHAFYNVKWKYEITPNENLYVCQFSLLFQHSMGDVRPMAGYESFEIDTLDEMVSNVMFTEARRNFTQMYTKYFAMMGQDVRMLNGSVVYSSAEQNQSSDNSKSECPIMYCFFLGTINGITNNDSYKYGSTESDIGPDGHRIVDFSLSFSSTDGIYNTFYQTFDKLLQRSFIPVSYEVDIPIDKLYDFNMCLPVLIDHTPIWPERLRYEISEDGIRIIEFTGRILKEYNDN